MAEYRHDDDYYTTGPGAVRMPEHENHTPLLFTNEIADQTAHMPMEVRMMLRMLEGAMTGLDTYPETNDLAVMAKAHVQCAMTLLQRMGKSGE